MFTIHPHTKKLTELSLKQREHVYLYNRDKVVRVRPEPIVVPPRDLVAETPRNTPT